MNKEREIRTWDISWLALIKIATAIVLFYFIYLIREIFLWFLFALVLAILFDPAIELLTKRKIPRAFSALLVYFSFFAIFVLAIYVSAPFVISEMRHFLDFIPQQFPMIFERISPTVNDFGMETSRNITDLFSGIQNLFSQFSRNILGTVGALVGGIIALFFIFGTAFFLSLESKFVEKVLSMFFPKKYESYLLKIWRNSKDKVVGWFLMRIIGIIFVWMSSYLVFILLGVNYPFSLSALFGIFDIVPIIGPNLAAIFIFIVIATEDLLTASLALLAMIIIQMLEGVVIFPLISKRMIKVPPLVVLLSLFIGGKLWGVIGAIIAVPLFAMLFEFSKDFLRERKENLFK
jgi:predicted PurR-regulated permease PerM